MSNVDCQANDELSISTASQGQVTTATVVNTNTRLQNWGLLRFCIYGREDDESVVVNTPYRRALLSTNSSAQSLEQVRAEEVWLAWAWCGLELVVHLAAPRAFVSTSTARAVV
jgi:hypothetical protein